MQLLEGQKHTFALPPLILGVVAPPRPTPPLSMPLCSAALVRQLRFNHHFLISILLIGLRLLLTLWRGQSLCKEVKLIINNSH